MTLDLFDPPPAIPAAFDFRSLLSDGLPRVYAGIGSRETPRIVCDAMTAIARALAARGWTLRSGGAEKADQAFEAGVPDEAFRQIFLPWKGFEDSRSPYHPPYVSDGALTAAIDRLRAGWIPRLLDGTESSADIVAHAHLLAERFHPAWHKVSAGSRKLHSRNGHQVLGLRLNAPSDVVIAWTKDGRGSGGTGQAIRIAESFGIPVLNLKRPADLDMVLDALGLVGFDRLALLRAPPEPHNRPLR